jgi:hypothetical protein
MIVFTWPISAPKQRPIRKSRDNDIIEKAQQRDCKVLSIKSIQSELLSLTSPEGAIIRTNGALDPWSNAHEAGARYHM